MSGTQLEITDQELQLTNRIKYCGENGNSFIHDLARLPPGDSCALFLRLKSLFSNIELDKKNDFGDTPLHIARNLRNSALAQLLLNAGADPSIKNQQGETAWSNSENRISDFIRSLESDSANNVYYDSPIGFSSSTSAQHAVGSNDNNQHYPIPGLR